MRGDLLKGSLVFVFMAAMVMVTALAVEPGDFYDADDAENWTSYALDCTYTKYWVICNVADFSLEGECPDGTPHAGCSASRPLYCDNGTFISNCSLCGCPSGQECSGSSTCYAPLPSPPPRESAFCEESWVCTGWSECVGGIRVRGCTISECVKEWDIPHTSETCGMPEAAPPVGPREGVIVPEEANATIPEEDDTGPEEPVANEGEGNPTGYGITGMVTGIDTMFLGTMFMMILVVSGLAYFFSRSRI